MCMEGGGLDPDACGHGWGCVLLSISCLSTRSGACVLGVQRVSRLLLWGWGWRLGLGAEPEGQVMGCPANLKQPVFPGGVDGMEGGWEWSRNTKSGTLHLCRAGEAAGIIYSFPYFIFLRFRSLAYLSESSQSSYRSFE